MKQERDIWDWAWLMAGIVAVFVCAWLLDWFDNHPMEELNKNIEKLNKNIEAWKGIDESIFSMLDEEKKYKKTTYFCREDHPEVQEIKKKFWGVWAEQEAEFQARISTSPTDPAEVEDLIYRIKITELGEEDGKIVYTQL